MKHWVKIYNQLLDWEHFTEPSVLSVWMYLLLSAETKSRSVRGRRVTIGEVHTSYREMSSVTGLSHNTVKAAIEKLTATGEIRVETSIAGTRIMILKFSTFQGFPVSEKTDGSVSMVDTPTDTPTTTTHTYINSSSNIENKEYKNSDTNVSGGQKKKKAEKIEKAVTRYDQVFERVFKNLTGDVFMWSKRENVAVNTIVGKIAKMMEEAGADPTDAEQKERNLEIFLNMLWDTGDNWIRTNFIPHVISDKFQEYYQRIKNHGKNQRANNPTGVSADYLASVIRDLNGDI